jgi:thioredoxin reductase (NADPH)
MSSVRAREATNDAECIIIGGGPGGLAAATYLARFLRRCVVIDAGGGRASMIPKSHNLHGHPAGISGPELLARMRNHALRYGASIRQGKVDKLVSEDGGYAAVVDGEKLWAPTVILATGVINHRPVMPAEIHDNALARGLIRYCAVCDGFEARGMNIAVLGSDEHGLAEAEFLLRYSKRITLLAQGSIHLTRADEAWLAGRHVQVVQAPVRTIRIDGSAIVADLQNGEERRFDTLYPALGSTARTPLAAVLGANLTKDGCLNTDAHQQTNLPGLFGVGDVVAGLDQIAVATGQAAKAATAIHNLLSELDNSSSLALGYQDVVPLKERA